MVYMCQEYRKMQREFARMDAELLALKVRGAYDKIIIDWYVQQRETAKKAGDSDTASHYDQEIAKLVLSYIQ